MPESGTSGSVGTLGGNSQGDPAMSCVPFVFSLNELRPLCLFPKSCQNPLSVAVKKPAPPKVNPFPAGKKRRLDELLEKNSEGTITLKEKAKLERLDAEAEQLMVANAGRLAENATGTIWQPFCS
jgi:hypothetical protein